jgi:hypothetical protein
MQRQRLSFAAFFILLFSAGTLFSAHSAHAAALTWDNDSADGLWSTCANWTSDICPGVGDTVTFDASVSDTNSTVDTSFGGEVGAVTILSGFTATITQDRSLSVTKNGWASGNWTQAGGSFAGSTQDIIVDGTYTLSGGTFTSTTGNLSVRGDLTISSGGTFNPSTGTVTAVGYYAYWNVDSSETFYNFTANKSDYWGMDFAAGDTINVDGALLLSEGSVNSGLINARGDVTQSANFDGGNVTIDLENSSPSAQTVTLNGGSSPVYRLDDAADAADSIVFAADTRFKLTVTSGFGSNIIPIDNSGDHIITLSAYSQAAGTWDASGTTLMKTNNNSGTVFVTISGGTFVAPQTLELTGLDNVIDINSTQDFNNLKMNLNAYWSTWMYTGDVWNVDGTLTLTSGAFQGGTLNARGNVVQASTYGGGSAILDFGSTGSQTYDINGGYTPTVRLDSADDASDAINVNADVSMRLSITSSFGANIVPIVNAGNKVISFRIYDQAAGTFDASGMSLIKMEAPGSSPSFTMTGGTFVAPTTFEMRGYDSTLDVNGTQVFNNLNVYNSWTCILGSGDTVTTTGVLNLAAGFGCAQGTFEAAGNVVVSPYFGSSWSNTSLVFTGTGTQTFDLTGATGNFNGAVTVTKSAGRLDLASDLVMDASGKNLTIVDGTLYLAGHNLTVNGSGSAFTVQSNGILRLQGNESITGTPDLQSGSSVNYVGHSGPYTLKNYVYSRLNINGSGATFNLPGDLDVNSNLTITAGTLDATTSNYAIYLAGNWINNASFNARGGAVILDGASQSVRGTTTFNDFSKSVTSASAVIFDAGVTQTFTGTLTLGGASGNLLTVRSNTAGTQASLDPQGAVSVSYAAVKDNNNVNATAITCGAGCVNNGNNTNWIF